MKKTKIICSIGPASTNPKVMAEMVKSGMNVARINFSHATLEERKAVVKSVKEVRKTTGSNIGILYDTKGPEFRNDNLENGKVELIAGNTIRIVKEKVLGNQERFSVNHPSAIDSLEIGNIILLENGLMKLEVISKEIDGVTCRIIDGGVLGNKKSLSVPGVKLDIPFISEQDREDLIYACENDGDFVALSFVNTKEDVIAAKAIFDSCNRSDMRIIAKIESRTGVENVDSILDVANGIMIARGDLGVEVPIYELPIIQKNIIKKCRERGKICIVATEMLESMKKNIRPTRAEVSDISNAVLEGTDAVMLSGETTVGKYPVQTVKYMAEICEFAEDNYNYDHKFKDLTNENITSTIAKGVVEATRDLDIKAIIAPTASGYTPKRMSNLKPKAPIIAGCNSEKVAYSLALNWGVYPILIKPCTSIEEVLETTLSKELKESFGLSTGDNVIVTGSFPINLKTRTTNLMKIETL